MLGQADNELVTRVGPGTPLGALMREYWLPVLFSSELPGADSDPLRVRLLGEDLVAYRDTSGKVGLLGDHCPHRGASLFFGRNEEQGLRCVYHGWKFDTTGACVDMPNEPPESNFKDKIHHLAYPCAERNGIVWTYMGPQNPPPTLPELEWNLVPSDQSYVSKRVANCNWLQSLEGAIDNSHSNFLHAAVAGPGEPGGSLFERSRGGAPSAASVYTQRVSYPRFETLNVAAGVLVANQRPAEPGRSYWRVNAFLMPFYTQFPARGVDPPFSGHAWVPIDDEHTLVFHFTYHALRPLEEPELAFCREGRSSVEGFHPRPDGFLPPTSEPFGAWRPRKRKENDYELDRAYQRTVAFSGINSGWAQDSAVQEGMGPIYDRTSEHLGSSDVGIIAVRRFVLEAARAHHERAVLAPGMGGPSTFAIRAAAFVLPDDETPWERALEVVKAEPGVAFTVV